jgi:hypothetical protein
MSLDRTLWTQERNVPTVVPEGVETESWGVVATGLMASINRKRSQSDYRFEETRNAGGPGIQTQTLLLLVFHVEDFAAGFPSVLVNDRFYQASGPHYKVLFVRDTYETTLQVDVELVA